MLYTLTGTSLKLKAACALNEDVQHMFQYQTSLQNNFTN